MPMNLHEWEEKRQEEVMQAWRDKIRGQRLNENYLRNKWVAPVMGEDVRWFDPDARTVGIPDAEFNVGNAWIPIELKFWSRSQRYRHVRPCGWSGLRPSQWRYNRLLMEQGKRSAVLYGRNPLLKLNKSVDFEVYLIAFNNFYDWHFRLCEGLTAKEWYDSDKGRGEIKGSYYVGTDEDKTSAKDKILYFLGLKEFWQ